MIKLKKAKTSGMVSLLERFIFANRENIIPIFLFLTFILLWSATQLRIDAGFNKLLPLEHEYIKVFTEYQKDFGGANQVLIALKTKEGDIFTPEFLDTLNKVTQDVFFLPGVDRSRVNSLWTPNVRYREVVEDGIRGGNVIPPDYQPTPEGAKRVRQNVLKSDVLGRLVANDFSGAIVSAELMEVNPRTGEKLDYQQVAENLEALRGKYETEQTTLHIIGFAKVVGDMAEGASRVVVFFGLAFLITAVLVYGYTRSKLRTFFLLISALTAVVWQIGLLPIFGLGIDPMGILVPFLVFAIAVSHGVQMVSANGAELFDGADPLEAARESFRKIAVPSIAALATDVVGFITILLIKIRIIQEMALTASLGVAVIIITNLFLLPVLLSYAQVGVNYRDKLHRRAKSVEGLWRRMSQVAEPKAGGVVIIIALCLLGVGLWKSPDILVGDTQRGVPELRPDSRYNLDTELIADNFSIGVDMLTVYAEAPPDACIDYAAMSYIDDFGWHVENLPGVQSTVSLAGVSKVVNGLWNEGNPKWQVLSRTPQLMAQTVGNVPTSSGLLNQDCSTMPMYVFTTDHKAETIDGIVAAIKEYRDNNPSDLVKLHLAGGNVGVMAATNEEVVASQTPILLYVFAAVIVFCLLSFRSLRAVLCILLPLGLVSLLGYAVMAVLGIGLKVNTLPIVALGVGVGVDYGIYIYGRLKSYLDDGIPLRRAYELTLDVTGNGVLLTGLSLAVGVATWIFSPLQFQADMGILLTFLFLVNMLGAVFLLPALACWLLPKQRKNIDMTIEKKTPESLNKAA